MFSVMQRHMADESDAPHSAFQSTCANARPGEVFAPINYVRYVTCPVITQLFTDTARGLLWEYKYVRFSSKQHTRLRLGIYRKSSLFTVMIIMHWNLQHCVNKLQSIFSVTSGGTYNYRCALKQRYPTSLSLRTTITNKSCTRTTTHLRY
jgi:hypothetical protein